VDVVNKGLFARVRLSEAKSNNNNNKNTQRSQIIQKKVFPDFLLSKHYVNIILFVNRKKVLPHFFCALFQMLKSSECDVFRSGFLKEIKPKFSY